MARQAFLFILSISFLALHGSSRLYATLQQTFLRRFSATCASPKSSDPSAAVKSRQAFHAPAIPGTGDDSVAGIEPEEDDDSVKPSSRKPSELAGYFPLPFRFCFCGDAAPGRKMLFPACTHLALQGTSKYLLHRAIRI